MKLFSTVWKSSRKASKQRKYRINAPLHIRKKFVTAPLAKELRTRYGAKSLELRKGDTVRVVKGEFSGLTGKVSQIKLKEGVVYVDGAERQRKEGTKSFAPIQASSLLIVEVNVDDKRRAASLANKANAKKV